MKDRSQGGIFFSSLRQNLTKVCEISMVGQLVRTPLAKFWIWASSKNDYKIIKSFDCTLEIGQHSNHCLHRQCIANGKGITRNSHSERHVDFSIATFGFCDQSQKIRFLPCETNKVSGLNNSYRENDFGSFREKIKACVSTMSRDFQATKNLSIKSRKVSWPAVIKLFYQRESSFDISNRNKY